MQDLESTLNFETTVTRNTKSGRNITRTWNAKPRRRRNSKGRHVASKGKTRVSNASLETLFPKPVFQNRTNRRPIDVSVVSINLYYDFAMLVTLNSVVG